MEHIPDIEDREFPTSQGHWTGDITWEEEPFPGEPPCITATVNEDNPTADLALAWPYIDTEPGYEHTLNIYLSAKDGDSDNATGYATLTDGVYSYTIDGLAWFGAGFPYLNELIQAVPEDWDVENTQLQMHFDFVEDVGLTIMIVKLNLESEDITAARADHLPLMGVH
jgi:hypothetical protein